MHTIVFYIILSVLAFGFILERILDYLNSKTWTDELPLELRDVYDQSFGSLAIIDFHSKFKHASKLLERYLKEEDLPADCFTPRSLYLRGVSKAQLFRRRLLTRKENELLAMTLAHHGLGDVRMAPVMEVKCLKRFFLHYCEVLTFRIIDLLTKHLSPLSPTNYYLT